MTQTATTSSTFHAGIPPDHLSDPCKRARSYRPIVQGHEHAGLWLLPGLGDLNHAPAKRSEAAARAWPHSVSAFSHFWRIARRANLGISRHTVHAQRSTGVAACPACFAGDREVWRESTGGTLCPGCSRRLLLLRLQVDNRNRVSPRE